MYGKTFYNGIVSGCGQTRPQNEKVVASILHSSFAGSSIVRISVKASIARRKKTIRCLQLLVSNDIGNKK